ncbi:MAG TPA: hypothetical protein VNF73_15640 [Candidatus Saccharimonadales bacterium]|nr:hypothetical protein [Candidatus Saccharimonadales bacterium]
MSSVPRTITRLLISGALLAIAAGPVQASGATPSTIRIEVVGSTETFSTTGGTLCPSGTAVSFNFHFAGGNRAGSFHLDKTLTCDDGSGSFTIHVDAATVFGSPTDQGGWSVAGGTGAYASLAGGGNLVGTYTEAGINDLYTGRVTH